MRDYLKHHGIKGQEWGKKNGPPYPLDYDDHTAKQKRLNNKSTIGGKKEIRSVSDIKSIDPKERKSIDKSEKRKKYIRTGAIIVGSALAIYAGYKIGQKYGLWEKFSSIGKKVVNEAEHEAKTDGSATFTDLTGRQIERMWKKDSGEINGAWNATANCASNAFAMCCSAEGLKVKSTNVHGVSSEVMFNELVPDGYRKRIVNVNPNTSRKMGDILTQQILKDTGGKDGSHGIIDVLYSSRMQTLQGGAQGHATNFLVKDGKVIFYNMFQDGHHKVQDISWLFSDNGFFNMNHPADLLYVSDYLKDNGIHTYDELIKKAPNKDLIRKLLQER